MKILWIAKNDKAAKERAKMLDPERKRRFEDDVHTIMLPGAVVLGRRFDEVIFDGFNPYAVSESMTEAIRIVDWLDHSVRTTLKPGGVIRILTRGL